MLSSKSKSGLSDASNNKITPATPRVSKIGRPGSAMVDLDSPSPQQNPRLSIDRSPRSADSKPLANRRSPKIRTTPDKHQRLLKGSEVQEQLNAVQEDLKKAKEQLAFEEKEMARVLGELGDTKKAVEAANEKLAEAILAQKNAEVTAELDKFRADEMEQLAIEAAQKREEKWKKELEEIMNEHAVNVAALLSATQELQRAKQELATTIDAKNTAMSHADNAMKIAEINAEKVEILSGELSHLKLLLDSQLESKSKETSELINKLGSEIEALKLELENTKLAEEKLPEMEAFAERLKNDVMDAKKAESDAVGLVGDWKKKVELLESGLEKANKSERVVQDSLVSLTKQLEESKSKLDDAESVVISFRGKVEALELEVTRHKTELEESDHQLYLAKQEALDVGKAVEVLESEIQRLEEEKAQGLNNVKLATSSVESLTQENNKLTIELEATKEEAEKVKKAMEGLSSALHEVSMEARDMQESLLIKQVEVENATAEVEDLKFTVKNTQEKYEVMLDETKYEIVLLKKTLDKSETEAKESRVEWDAKELTLATAIKKSEEEIVSIKLEMEKAMEMLEKKKHDANAKKEEANKLCDKIRQAKSELIAANKAVEEAKAESMCLKERLLDKENELQNITQENDDLRIRETAVSEKIKVLSVSLAEMTSKRSEDDDDDDIRGNAEYGENGEISNSDKECDILPKMVEVMEDEVNETEKGFSEAPSEETLGLSKEGIELEENGYENAEEGREVVKACEDGETMDKQTLEMEHSAESIDDELDKKSDSNNLYQVNGENAKHCDSWPTQQQQLQKKKALLRKLRSLIKKKNNPK